MIGSASWWMTLIGGISLLVPAHGREAAPVPWHRVQRVIDITGDGKPDTLSLTAFGTEPDTLHIVLQIHSAGRVVYTDRWVNTDEFIDYDSATVRDRRALARDVRRKLDSFFADSNFSQIREDTTIGASSNTATGSDCGMPLECVASDLRFEHATRARVRRGLSPTPSTSSAYYDFMERVERSPFDTALVRRIGAEWRTSRALSFTYSHGYETTQTIVWSGVARRFFRVYECC